MFLSETVSVEYYRVYSFLVGSFYLFLFKSLTSADFKQDGNKEDLKTLLIFSHIKSANIPTLSLITSVGIFETWETLFLFSFSISFLMSSALTSVKQNVFASHWL